MPAVAAAHESRVRRHSLLRGQRIRNARVHLLHRRNTQLSAQRRERLSVSPRSNGQRLRTEDRKLPCNWRAGKDVGNSLRNISYQTELESVGQRVAVDN